jgi:hypothetical protein
MWAIAWIGKYLSNSTSVRHLVSRIREINIPCAEMKPDAAHSPDGNASSPVFPCPVPTGWLSRACPGLRSTCWLLKKSKKHTILRLFCQAWRFCYGDLLVFVLWIRIFDKQGGWRFLVGFHIDVNPKRHTVIRSFPVFYGIPNPIGLTLGIGINNLSSRAIKLIDRVNMRTAHPSKKFTDQGVSR